jgi:hypothetical protein
MWAEPIQVSEFSSGQLWHVPTRILRLSEVPDLLRASLRHRLIVTPLRFISVLSISLAHQKKGRPCGRP